MAPPDETCMGDRSGVDPSTLNRPHVIPLSGDWHGSLDLEPPFPLTWSAGSNPAPGTVRSRPPRGRAPRVTGSQVGQEGADTCYVTGFGVLSAGPTAERQQVPL